MECPTSLFTLFGGIRSMARLTGELPSTVGAWAKVGRIPAAKQPRILANGIALGLPITPELIIFPTGVIPFEVRSALHAQSLERATGQKYGNKRGIFPQSEQAAAA